MSGRKNKKPNSVVNGEAAATLHNAVKENPQNKRKKIEVDHNAMLFLKNSLDDGTIVYRETRQSRKKPVERAPEFEHIDLQITAANRDDEEGFIFFRVVYDPFKGETKVRIYRDRKFATSQKYWSEKGFKAYALGKIKENEETRNKSNYVLQRSILKKLGLTSWATYETNFSGFDPNIHEQVYFWFHPGWAGKENLHNYQDAEAIRLQRGAEGVGKRLILKSDIRSSKLKPISS